MNRIDFYYWSWQCPLNKGMVDLLKKYENRMKIHFHDISDRQKLAGELRMYFPTLTVLNKKYRYFAPLRETFLEEILSGMIPQETPFWPKPAVREKACEIVPITRENYVLAGGCTGAACERFCRFKTDFLDSCMREAQAKGAADLSDGIYGFMNVSGNQLLGGAEYLPSVLVPYEIPRHKKTAFLTCLYLSDSAYDYKSAPLRALERYLGNDYERAVVVSDEYGVFPNGDMAFFIKNGYRDQGVLSEEAGYCRLHLMEKELRR